MKKIFFTLVTVLMFSACNENVDNNESTKEVEVVTGMDNKETFKMIDMSIVENLNDSISSRDMKIEEEIMHIYKPKSTETEGNYSYTISKNDIGNDSQEVILIEDGLMDDALAAEKTIMIIRKENSKLKVISIKENYKCRKGRGHQNWSAELCN